MAQIKRTPGGSLGTRWILLLGYERYPFHWGESVGDISTPTYSLLVCVIGLFFTTQGGLTLIRSRHDGSFFGMMG